MILQIWNRYNTYFVAILSFRQSKSDQCLFICTLFLSTMVPQKLTHWKAPHVTDLSSAVHCLFCLAWIFLFFFLLSSHWSLCFFSPPSLTLCLTHFLPPFFLYLPHSNPSPSRSLSPSPLLSIESWSTDYTVTFCFILSQTPEGKPFQDISQQSNTPTLSLSQTWAHKPAHRHANIAQRTHTRFFLLHTCVLNLPQLIGFYHSKTFCVSFANKPSSNKSEDGICWRQETALFIYRFINVWMQWS